MEKIEPIQMTLDMILQGISLLLRAEFPPPEPYEDVYEKLLCEDTDRWFARYNNIKSRLRS